MSNTLPGVLLVCACATPFFAQSAPPPCFDRDAMHTIALPASTTDLTVADLNADGVDEILLSSEGDIIVRWGGPFTDSALPTLLDGDDYTAPVICDENHDGLLDVFVCSPTMSEVHLQQDDGSFYPLSRAYPQAHAADFGNFDSDDMLDYVTFFNFHSWPDMMFVRIMDDDGSYHYTYYLVFAYVFDVQAADFNGDGFDDIALTGMAPVEGIVDNGTFGVMLNDGTGSFHEPQWWLGSHQAMWMTIYDVDRDGDLDAAVSVWDSPGTAGSVRIDFHINDGDAQFTRERPTPPAGWWPYTLGQDLADVDGDGSPDLVASNYDEVYVFHGTTPGSFELWQVFYEFGGRRIEEPAFGDFNGDGTLDLVYLNTDDGLGFDPETDLTIIPGTCIHTCPGDANQTGEVDVFDMLELLSAWGACAGCDYDLTGDDVIDVLDLTALLNNWGECD